MKRGAWCVVRVPCSVFRVPCGVKFGPRAFTQHATRNTPSLPFHFSISSFFILHFAFSSFFLEKFGLHFGNQVLGEIVQFDGPDSQGMHQAIVTEHGRDGHQQTRHSGN